MEDQPGTAQQAADQARQQMQQGADQARGALRGQVEQRSTDAGRRLSTQASDMRTVAQQLREQGKDGPAKVAEQAAERTERVGSYLEQSDADRILGDVERYARDNPWAVVAGGLAAGFLASRFVKASTQQRRSRAAGGTRAEHIPPSTPAPSPAPPGVGAGVGGGFAPPAHPGVPTGAGRIG